MEDIKKTIGKNLLDLRKEKKLTQLEVADIFGYSDKAISKWENGDTLPDVQTLYDLANFYGVSLNYLTTEDSAEKNKHVLTNNTLKANRISIICLIVSLVWMIATIIFVRLLIFNNILFWQVFIISVPVSTLILNYFNRKWGKRKYFFYINTIFIWFLILSIYLSLLSYNLWPLFIVGVPAQLSLFLWTRMSDGIIKTIKTKK